MNGWHDGWMWWWGALMMGVWLVVIVGVTVWALRTFRRGPSERAREILAERLARGELSTSEYRDRIEALR